MHIYIVYHNGAKTNSKVMANSEEKALKKAVDLNEKYKMYSGTITVLKQSFI